MLNFSVELDLSKTKLFSNLALHQEILRECLTNGVSYQETRALIHRIFAHLTELEKLELLYEGHETYCVMEQRERLEEFCYPRSLPVTKMLYDRNGIRHVQGIGRFNRQHNNGGKNDEKEI